MNQLVTQIISKKSLLSFVLGIVFAFASIFVYCSISHKNSITIDLTESKITPSKDNPIIAIATNDKSIEVYLSEVQNKINLVPELASQGILFKDLNKEAQNLFVKEVAAEKLLSQKLLKSDILISKRKIANISKVVNEQFAKGELNIGIFNEGILLTNSYIISMRKMYVHD